MFVYTYNRLSNPLSNRLYRVYKHSTGGLTNDCIVYTAGCQTGSQTGLTGLYNRFDNRVRSTFVQHGCQTLFVKPVVSCKRGFTKLTVTGVTASALIMKALVLTVFLCHSWLLSDAFCGCKVAFPNVLR